MAILIVLPNEEFRDESVNTTRLFLDKWRVPYSFASFGTGMCRGSHGESLRHDLGAAQARPAEFDALVLIDGDGVEAQRLYEYRPMLDLVARFSQARKLICAIGNTMKIAARANVVNGKRFAEAPDEDTRSLMLLFNGVPSANAFEVSDNLMTVRDSGQLSQAIQELLKRIGVY